MIQKTKLELSVVDDHQLFRSGLVQLLKSFGNQFSILSESSNGQEFLNELKKGIQPDIVLLDVNMPILDGHETMKLISKQFPHLKVIALTMNEDEETLIKMVRAGVSGFLSKDVDPEDLNYAINTVYKNGFYYSEKISQTIVHSLQNEVSIKSNFQLNEREKEFLELACSELTYKEIADKMCLSIKTVDGYRNTLFERFDLKSRVGMVLFAIKNKLVEIRN